MSIPKFRKIIGLMRWVNTHRPACRLPRDREDIFITSREGPLSKATSVCRYGCIVGKLDSDLEMLMVYDSSGLVDYLCRIHRDGEELPDDLLSHLKGMGRCLVRLSRVVGRLPEWLEDTIEEPKCLLDYAKFGLTDRLPARLEARLVGDADVAVRYAFDVVRGFASVRLPDELHTFLAMKAFEDTDHEGIKRYFKEIRRRPETVEAE